MKNEHSNQVIKDLCKHYKPLHLVLDFDHTLLLGNSTELFISSGWPICWGVWVDKLAVRTAKLASRRLGYEQDAWRVLMHITFLPHSLLVWKWEVGRIIRDRLNLELWKVGRNENVSKISIVTHGFKCLIAPLVRELERVHPANKGVALHASSLLNPSKTVRRYGKVKMLEDADGNLCWESTVAVSDSVEDADLLDRSGKGILVQWEEPDDDNPPAYFPFQYIAMGKFSGRHYLSRFIFGQDLVVWLLLYVSGAHDFLPALLFFISFHSLYELGYYENDHVAAKIEESPQVWRSKRSFAGYPIYFWGWATSLLSGLAACWSLNPEKVFLNFFLWASVLVVLRSVFYLYNRKPISGRFPLYLGLQFLKNFSGLVMMTANPAGLVLGIAHAAQHTIIYAIYRCDGEVRKFKREHVRFVIWAGLLIVLLVSENWALMEVSTALCALWAYYRVLCEKYGNNFTVSARIALASKQLIRKSVSFASNINTKHTMSA